MLFPIVLVPVSMGMLRFRTTPLLLLLWWPMPQFSIAGLLLHATQRPFWILNVRLVAWLGKIIYGLVFVAAIVRPW